MKHITLALSILFLVAVLAEAGGGPQNVLVVVNDSSLESLELGKFYQQQRGIPDRNIFHVRTTTSNDISVSSFSNEIRVPVVGYITNTFSSNQIDYIVFSKDIPYRVFAGDPTTNANSLTSAMFDDYRTGTGSCYLPSSTRHDYYEAERAFTRAGSPSSNRYILCALLAPANLAQARMVVSRSAASDFTQPTGTVYLYHSLDARKIQWTQFENTDFLARFLDILQQREIVEAFISGKTNVMGYMVGFQGVGDLMSNAFQPGAMGDHLTSFGGFLYDPDPGQMSIVEWLKAGCAGSYGTVIEPCLYTNKFPQAREHYWYGRGFSLGEAYFMAVRNPYQGVVAGDPLCQPYAMQPLLSIGGITSNQVASGFVAVTVTGTAVSASRPVDQIDLYLDGAFLASLTNMVPTRSNVVMVTINGTNCTYTIPLGASLFTAATGLAASVNASNVAATARAYGDRIEIKQTALGVSGTGLTCVATSSTGSAGRVTVFARTPFTNFLETTCAAYKQVTLSGTPVSGDVVRATVTRLDGVAVTNQVVAGTNDTVYSLLTSLAGIVTADTDLQTSVGCESKWVSLDYLTGVYEGFFIARTNVWNGYNLTLKFQVLPAGGGLAAVDWTNKFVDNAGVMSARATVFLSEGETNLSAGYSLNTANLSDGPHELTAVAYEGTAVKTQGRITIPFIVDNNTNTCAITNPPTGGTALLSESVTAYVQAPSATSVEFYVEGKLLASTHATPYVFLFAATNYGVGTVNLQAKAFASGGDSVLSSNVRVTVLPDYDLDALEDDWEIQNWGNITVTSGTNDWDGDSVNNQDEYTADTEPTNDTSFFQVSRIGWTNNQAQIEYVSSTTRQYRLHYSDGSLLDHLWMESSNWLWGSFGVTTQLDDGTLMPLPTNTYRFYRVRAHRP